MCAGSFQVESICFNPVYQKPVRLDVAVSKSAEVTGQGVVSLFWIKRLFIDKSNNHQLDFSGISAPSDHKVKILLELIAIDN